MAGVRGGVPKWEPRARLGIKLGPSPRHAGSVSLILNLQTMMVYLHYHLSYDDFFETVRPTVVNPPIYSHWQALKGLSKYEHLARHPKSTPPKRVEYPEAIIVPDAPIPPSEERDEKLPMEDLPAIDKYTPHSEVDSVSPLP